MSVTFCSERLTDGTFKVHLTDGRGTGCRVVVNSAMLTEMRQVLDLMVTGVSEYAEVGPFTKGQTRSWVPEEAHDSCSPAPAPPSTVPVVMGSVLAKDEKPQWDEPATLAHTIHQDAEMVRSLGPSIRWWKFWQSPVPVAMARARLSLMVSWAEMVVLPRLQESDPLHRTLTGEVSVARLLLD